VCVTTSQRCGGVRAVQALILYAMQTGAKMRQTFIVMEWGQNATAEVGIVNGRPRFCHSWRQFAKGTSIYPVSL